MCDYRAVTAVFLLVRQNSSLSTFLSPSTSSAGPGGARPPNEFGALWAKNQGIWWQQLYWFSWEQTNQVSC